MKFLLKALLGGSDRTSRQITSSSFSETRCRFCKEAIAYVGGSNTLIVGSQKHFTIGHALLGTRPRPANKK
jgi:hypothetical protein